MCLSRGSLTDWSVSGTGAVIGFTTAQWLRSYAIGTLTLLPTLRPPGHTLYRQPVGFQERHDLITD